MDNTKADRHTHVRSRTSSCSMCCVYFMRASAAPHHQCIHAYTSPTLLCSMCCVHFTRASAAPHHCESAGSWDLHTTTRSSTLCTLASTCTSALVEVRMRRKCCKAPHGVHNSIMQWGLIFVHDSSKAVGGDICAGRVLGARCTWTFDSVSLG